MICVFSDGDNRANGRRYEMGEVSAKMAYVTIVTSDNPRFEEPTEIMNDIEEGILRILTKHNLVEEEAIEYPVHSYVIIEDRIRAIQTVLSKAKEGDMIVIAGKGHETYQEIMGVKYPMDDSVIVNEYLSGGQNERNNSK